MSGPYLSDSDFTLWNGDACEVLAELPPESVQMCVTSPPFFGLRDYGTGTWEGGDAECDHRPTNGAQGKTEARAGRTFTGSQPQRQTCSRCGATRVDRQIGLEQTPEAWVEALVSVFEEVRRVLRKDGTLWVECGDSYASGEVGRHDGYNPTRANGSGTQKPFGPRQQARLRTGTKPKDLIGQPFLLAFALREAGWYWRNVCIWHKPNPMPESVRDRFTVSHSYVLLFSKSPRYFFDAEAVREPHNPDGRFKVEISTGPNGHDNYNNREGKTRWPGTGRNARSVWTIPTEPLPFEHYAAFPQALAERCIKAGTSEWGSCPECGAPWVRETSEALAPTKRTPPPNKGRVVPRSDGEDRAAHVTHDGWVPNREKTVTTLGWRWSCSCYGWNADLSRDPIPCTVLDPFMGSGTTALVVRRLGRRCIGIELNENYCRLAAERTKQLSLLSEDVPPALEKAASGD